MYQHDPRHIDVLVKDLGLENGTSAQTPATPEVTEEEKPGPLSQVQHHKYRSQVARCLFLSQDRSDITFIVNELCQRMSNPTQQSLVKLKRLTRYLKRERQWGKEDSEVIKRWCGDAWCTRLEGVHSKTEDHCEEQCRGRAVCGSIGSVRIERNRVVAERPGYEKKPVLAIDAKATEHILHRQGIGKLKHIDVAYLWIQDEVRSHRLRVRRVRSEDNVADLGTKPLSKAVIAKHCLALGIKKMFRWTVKSWRCSGTSVQQSARSSRQQVTMSREQPAENRSNRSIRSTRSSGSKQARSLCLGS